MALPAEFLARAMGRLLGQTLRLGSGSTEGYFVAHSKLGRGARCVPLPLRLDVIADPALDLV